MNGGIGRASRAIQGAATAQIEIRPPGGRV